MDQGYRSVGERHAGVGGAQHGFTGFGIAGNAGRNDVGADQPHGVERHGVGVVVPLAADIGFDRVGQGIQAGVGGDAERQFARQVGVDDGGLRQAGQAHEDDLFMGGGIGDHDATGDFGPGAGGGRHAEQRQRAHRWRVRDAPAADVALAVQHQVDGLGGIHGAAAAKPMKPSYDPARRRRLRPPPPSCPDRAQCRKNAELDTRTGQCERRASNTGVETNPRSVTTSGRLTPIFGRASPIRASAPAPNRISAGV